MGKTNYQTLQIRLAYTVEQAALVLGVGKDKINEKIDSGEIGVVKAFGGMKIPKFELESFMAKNLMRKIKRGVA